MIELSDEMLNKYLDGELEHAELRQVHEILKESDEARKRLKALQAVHLSLRQMKESFPSEEFTSLVMSRLYNKVKSKQGQKVFIYSVSAVFILLVLAAAAFAFSIILNSAAVSSPVEMDRAVVFYSGKIADIIKNIFSGSGISIFGSILSLGIIIFAYFFFEFQKNLKTKE